MRLLNKEDFKGFVFKTNQSGIDMLADICGVATEVLEQEKRRRLKGKVIIQQHRSSPPPSPSLQSYRKGNESKAGDQIVHGLKLRIPKPPGQKRSRKERQESDDDDDWDHCDQESKKNSKKRQIRRPSNLARQPAPAADPALLPGEFRREIEAMGGKEIRLGIQKEITETDLKREHNRLSMPCSQIIDEGFLTEEEKDALRRQEAIEDVPLMIKRFQPPAEQRMEVTNINLRQWDMPKPSGKASSIYVLRTSWQYVVNRIGLRVRDVVLVCSFRVQEDRLHLALVVVSRTNHQLQLLANTGNTGTGAGTSGSSGSGSGSSGNTQIV